MRDKAFFQNGGSSRKVLLWLLVFGAVVASLLGTARADTRPGPGEDLPRPAVRLQAASGLAIDFQTQNGETIQDQAPQAKDIPHLVLFRNGQLAREEERTFRLDLSGLEVRPTGLNLHLKVETQHGDPDRGGDEASRIPVWEGSQCVPQIDGGQAAGLSLEQVFGETVERQGQPARTPNDYYRVEWIDRESYERLGLVIARLDSREG